MTIKTSSKVIAILSLLAGGLGCTANKEAVPPSDETVRNVSVLVAQRTSVQDYLEAPGTVRAAQTSQLASQIMGSIRNVAVREGDRVRSGQTLATIDELQQKAGLDRFVAGLSAAEQEVVAAEADYALADSTLKRYQGLLEKKSVSLQEFDEVKTRLAAAQARRDGARAGMAQAEAAVGQARSYFGYTRIRAPFDGVVTAKFADAGSMASPGMPLLVVEDTSRFRLEVTVDEAALASVRLGAPVPVVLDALGGQELQGKVVQLVPAADPASRTFTVKIELPKSSELHSGMFGRARFPRGQRDSMLIPQSAVLDRGQLRGIYVLGPDQVASLRYVTLGRTLNDKYEVLSGLDAGERVILQPQNRELAGRRIEVR